MSKSRWSFVGALLLGTVPALVYAAAGAGKVTLCHRTGAGEYHAIAINENAEGAHRAHGDAAPREPVPGAPGFRFNASCVPVPVCGGDEETKGCGPD